MPDFTPVLREDEIKRQISRIAQIISADYRGRELVLIGVLKGAFLFLADLARALTIERLKLIFFKLPATVPIPYLQRILF